MDSQDFENSSTVLIPQSRVHNRILQIQDSEYVLTVGRYFNHSNDSAEYMAKSCRCHRGCVVSVKKAADGVARMIFWFFRLARKLQRAIAADRQPKLLARGIAAGFLLGLVPAGNLISITIAIFIFCLRMNHAVAALTAITIALAAPIADPITHWLGTQILSAPTSLLFYLSCGNNH